MAKQLGGILGPVRGKVSNVVGSHWKETPYFRGYTIPANPNTEAQQGQRSKMTACVWVARQLLGSVINPYWDPFSKKITGYNRFVQVNIKRVEDPIDYLDMLVSEGKLEPSPQIDVATYNDTTGIVHVEWDTTIMGNGTDADKAVLVALDEENKVGWVSETDLGREEGSDQMTIGSGRDYSKIKAFCFFHSGTGATLMVSPSVGKQCTEDT